MGSTLFFILLTSACNTPDTNPPHANSVDSNSAVVATIENNVPEDDAFFKRKRISMKHDFKKISPKEVELIPVEKDSMLFHISFELSPNYYVTVAQPMKETKEGVRLQLQKKNKKGVLKVIDSSSPAYDSPQLYPTFFKNEDGDYIILANTGISDSWGIKVYSLIGKHFYDLGYIDMAMIEKRTYPDEDGRMEKYSNLSSHTFITADGSHLTFTFDAQNIILYEDLNHNRDVSIHQDEYYYTYDNKSFELHKK